MGKTVNAVKTKTATKTQITTCVVTQTVNKQEVSVVQSQALAQVAIHAAISAISCCRDLFEENAFVLKSMKDLVNLRGYEDYVQNAQRLSSEPDRRESTRKGYETLVRGQSKVVDDLLEQMKGVFAAIDQKTVKSLVFSVCLDASRPQDIVEAYTFTFTHRKTASGPSKLEMSMEGVANKVTFGDAKRSLCEFLYHVNVEMRNKPRLPAKRCIHLRLLYNDDWDGTRVPGFRTDAEGFALAETLGWTREATTPGSLVYDAGYQGMSIEASRLKPSDDSSIDDDVDASLPAKSLQYKKVKRVAFIDRAVDKHIDKQRQERAATLPEMTSPPTVQKEQTVSMPKDSLPRSSPFASQLHSQMSTQHREDFRTRAHLDRIINPSPLITNGGDTQLVPEAAQEDASESPQDKITWAQDIIDELDTCQIASPQAPGENIVDCECDANTDKGDLIKCHYCKRCQHAVCYGYLDRADDRLPDLHICYTCLLSGKEDTLLAQMQDIAFFRKVARAILKGRKTEKDIAKAIGRDLPSTKGACDRLVKDGYFIRVNAKKKTARMELVESERARLEAELLSPTVKITHHLAVQSPAAIPETAMSAGFTMPPTSTLPPKTPSNPKKRKSSTSGLDKETPLAKRLQYRTERGIALLPADRPIGEGEEMDDEL